MGFSPWALRNLLDNHQRVTQGGTTVYLRVMNDDSAADTDYATYGFQIAVTGNELAGTTDIEIEPPPDVSALSEKEIGIIGTTLKFGAHRFLISHTWVMNRMEQLGITDPYAVFRGDSETNVVGLFYDGRVFSIEVLRPESQHGEMISWTVLGNFLEPPENCA